MELILSHYVLSQRLLLHKIHWINNFHVIATEYPVPEVPVVQGYFCVPNFGIIRFSDMHGTWHWWATGGVRGWTNLFPLNAIDVTGQVAIFVPCSRNVIPLVCLNRNIINPPSSCPSYSEYYFQVAIFRIQNHAASDEMFGLGSTGQNVSAINIRFQHRGCHSDLDCKRIALSTLGYVAKASVMTDKNGRYSKRTNLSFL